MLKWLHKFVSPKGDDPDSTLVRPSDWNNDHEVTSETTTGFVIGRKPDEAGEGAVEELPLKITVDGSVSVTGSGQLVPPKGTTAQRPAAPGLGAMRYNTQTETLEIWGIGGILVWTPFDAEIFIKPGSVVIWPGEQVPNGWQECAGQLLLRASYPALFNAIGTKYGGDGITTFGVPDYRNCAVVGVSANFPLGELKGALLKSFTIAAANLPPHSHPMVTPFPMPIDGGAGVTGVGNALQAGPTVSETGWGTSANTPLSIDVVQPSKGAYWIIKT